MLQCPPMRCVLCVRPLKLPAVTVAASVPTRAATRIAAPRTAAGPPVWVSIRLSSAPICRVLRGQAKLSVKPSVFPCQPSPDLRPHEAICQVRPRCWLPATADNEQGKGMNWDKMYRRSSSNVCSSHRVLDCAWSRLGLADVLTGTVTRRVLSMVLRPHMCRPCRSGLVRR
jgi:hypothetical protein